MNQLYDIPDFTGHKADKEGENLKWMSHQDNLKYGFEHGNKSRMTKGNFAQRIIKINNNNKYGIVYSPTKISGNRGYKRYRL